MKTKIGIGAGFILGCILGGALYATTAAHAVTPTYEVTEDGLQLIAGETFQDSYHVNVKLEDDPQQRNMHIEAKCLTKTDHECAAVRHSHVGLTLHEEAQFIGKNYLPWSALGIKPGQCIEWLQVYSHDFHYGEQGEYPVCNVSVVEPPVVNPPVVNPPVVVVPDVPEVVDPPVSGKPDTPPVSEESDKPLPPERVETASGNVILFGTSWFTIGMVAGALLGAILVNSRDE